MACLAIGCVNRPAKQAIDYHAHGSTQLTYIKYKSLGQLMSECTTYDADVQIQGEHSI